MSLFQHERDGNAQKVIAALHDSSSTEVRRRAAEILGRMDDHDDRDDIVAALVRAVQEEESDAVVAAAVDALDELGQEAIEELITAMSDLDIGDDAADWVKVKAFVRALNADLPELRMAAANAIGELGVADAVPKLVEGFEDPDPRVRARAARACRNIADARATQPLTGLLGDPKAKVRVEAAEALGRIGNREALQALLQLYDDDSEQVRRIAVRGFGQFRNDRPVEYLAEALTDESAAVRRTAVFSLIELLSNVPTEKSHGIREAVVEQLSASEDPSVIDPLVEILDAGVKDAQRRNTAWLLGRVMDGDENRDAIDALVDTLAEGGKMTKQFAATSLAEVGAPTPRTNCSTSRTTRTRTPTPGRRRCSRSGRSATRTPPRRSNGSSTAPTTNRSDSGPSPRCRSSEGTPRHDRRRVHTAGTGRGGDRGPVGTPDH